MVYYRSNHFERARTIRKGERKLQDTELYTKLLGITSPWHITKVIFNDSPERIDVYLTHAPDILLPCPECKEYSPVYDHMKERSWQHLNTCHVPTYIHTKLPRIKCKEHGIRQIISDWAGAGADMTKAYESHAIDLQKECSIEGVTRLTGLGWHRCWGVMNRAVNRGLKRKTKRIPARIGVDEKSFARGHKYETLVYDLQESTVEYVGESRKQESLARYYEQFSKEELAAVEVITMDMWDPYIAATQAAIPGAGDKIVFDKFHIMRQTTEAVDKVRKQEHRELMQADMDWLKGTKFLWLWNEENIPEHRRKEFEGLRKLDLKVGRAWAVKENLRNLWNYHSKGWAERFFKGWYFWATHSRLEPVIEAAKTIKRHLHNILTYVKHRITNALGEGLNSKIEKIKRMACGYRNREHYKTAIYFHCGGLDLYPR